MKQKIFFILLIIILMITSFSFGENYNVKLTDFTYVRKNVNGQIIGSLGKNTVKTVYKEVEASNGSIWYRIWYNGNAAYIPSDVASKSFENIENFNVNTTDFIYVRRSVWGEKTGYLNKNTVKTVYGIRRDRFGNKWYRIWYNGNAAYILSGVTSKSFENIGDFNVNTTDFINVRRNIWSNKIGYLNKNTVKTVYGTRRDKFGNKWYRVWYNGSAAYIPSDATSRSLKKIDDYYLTIKDFSYVRRKVWGDKIGHVDKNTVKTIYGTRRDRFGNRWYRIWYDGSAGYIVRKNKYKHNQPLSTPGMVNVDGFIEASTIENPYVLKEVTKESLINKFNWLPEGYEPPKIKAIMSGNYDLVLLEEETANAYERLRQDAIKEGIYFVVFSGYRSYDLQQELYNNAYISDRLYAIKSIAYPGTSEHNSGYALDISYNSDFPQDFYSTPQGKFLKKNAHKYGFILRYPIGAKSITNYKYESWHYRYVGVDLATELKQRGITLEEYYGVDKFE